MVDKEKCTGCAACYSVCPISAIDMIEDEEGFLYPSIDDEKCIHCGKCVSVCPIIGEKRCFEPQKVAYAINKDEFIRLQSSSGGLFFALAKRMIDLGGIVVGCALSEDCRYARHIAVETMEELYALLGSKYLQSEINDVYSEVRDNLNKGKNILFSGTACQVAGLKSYLGKSYINLLTIDFICHGVPSPKVWRSYVDFRERQSLSPTQRMFFRHKKYGWKTYSVQFKFLNCTEYVGKLTEDPYMRGFIGNLYLRPACYQCVFKKDNYWSDITIADFWDVEKVHPELDDDKGVSLAVIRTDQGAKMFESVKCDLISGEVDLTKALEGNPSYYEPSKYNHWRTSFFCDLNKQKSDLPKLIKKYFGKSLLSRLNRHLFQRRKNRGCL